MLACTELSAASVGKPDVMTPSKNEPMSHWLLSPPEPMTMEPSRCIGEYPAGRAPLYQVVTPPVAAFPPFSGKLVMPLFLSMAVPSLLAFPKLLGLEPI